MKNHSDNTQESGTSQPPWKSVTRSEEPARRFSQSPKGVFGVAVASPNADHSTPLLAVCAVPEIHADAVQQARKALPARRDVQRTAALFHLLANDTRLRIVLALREAQSSAGGTLCVCDLAEIAGASESMTSHQLRLLREAKIVTFRRAGKLALYRLQDGPIGHLLADALEYVSKRYRQ